MKLSETQLKIVEALREGAIIDHFRGIGTRYTPSASLEDSCGKQIQTVSVATVKALRNKNILEEFSRDYTHSKYKIKTA